MSSTDAARFAEFDTFAFDDSLSLPDDLESGGVAVLEMPELPSFDLPAPSPQIAPEGAAPFGDVTAAVDFGLAGKANVSTLSPDPPPDLGVSGEAEFAPVTLPDLEVGLFAESPPIAGPIDTIKGTWNRVTGGGADGAPSNDSGETGTGGAAPDASDTGAFTLSGARDIGLTLGGFVPGIGETIDLYTLFAPGSSGLDRGLAAGSLGINLLTAGLAPNFGGAASQLDEGVDLFRSVGNAGSDALPGGSVAGDITSQVDGGVVSQTPGSIGSRADVGLDSTSPSPNINAGAGFARGDHLINYDLVKDGGFLDTLQTTAPDGPVTDALGDVKNTFASFDEITVNKGAHGADLNSVQYGSAKQNLSGSWENMNRILNDPDASTALKQRAVQNTVTDIDALKQSIFDEEAASLAVDSKVIDASDLDAMRTRIDESFSGLKRAVDAQRPPFDIPGRY